MVEKLEVVENDGSGAEKLEEFRITATEVVIMAVDLGEGKADGIHTNAKKAK